MCIRGRPESRYALRVGGWVKPKTYSRIQGGWVGKAQSVSTLRSRISAPPIFLEEIPEGPMLKMGNIFNEI